ncbi:MAG: hypothetical protein ACOH18_00080 [Candidatus Saccharimonadaceae bacterium]
MTEPYSIESSRSGNESSPERLTPGHVFGIADELFQGVAYGQRGYSDGEQGFREISGTLYDEFGLPLVPVAVVDRLKEDSSREINVRVSYLSSDGTRLDRSVIYLLAENDETPQVEHHVNYGDTAIPFQPFSDKPEAPLVLMQKALKTVYEERMRADVSYRDKIWCVTQG